MKQFILIDTRRCNVLKSSSSLDRLKDDKEVLEKTTYNYEELEIYEKV